MRAVVDQETCIGCGLCCEICGAVFHMNDEGKAEAYREADETAQDGVETAIGSCPVAAISRED